MQYLQWRFISQSSLIKALAKLKGRMALIMYLLLHTTSLLPVPFFLGIENEADHLLQRIAQSREKDLKIGFIANHTSKDQQGNRSLEVLCGRGIPITKIFAPEHGFEGMQGAAHTVHDSIDKNSSIPIISLYGHGSGKKITESKVKGLNLLLFDMQDVGMRHFTYISTLFTVMEAAAAYDIPLIIFDRPNPLGAVVEGPRTQIKSFIAIAPIPLRHGMTIGELGHYFNKTHLHSKVRLHVVPMLGYQRTMGLPGPLLAPLSPNLPTKEACLCYSFLGLLAEVKPFDTGLGTPKAFQCLALADSLKISKEKWYALQRLIKEYGVESKLYSYYSPRKKAKCTGLLFDIPDINKVSAFQIMLTTLKFFKDAKIPLTFSKSFDTAVGTKKVREWIEGAISKDKLMQEVHKGLGEFFTQAQTFYYYKPLPVDRMVK